jgi:hypothetical protein
LLVAVPPQTLFVGGAVVAIEGGIEAEEAELEEPLAVITASVEDH